LSVRPHGMSSAALAARPLRTRLVRQVRSAGAALLQSGILRRLQSPHALQASPACSERPFLGENQATALVNSRPRGDANRGRPSRRVTRVSKELDGTDCLRRIAVWPKRVKPRVCREARPRPRRTARRVATPSGGARRLPGVRQSPVSFPAPSPRPCPRPGPAPWPCR